MLSAERFTDIAPTAPNFEQLRAEYDGIAQMLSPGGRLEEAAEAFSRWDALRRRFTTWASFTDLRFRQDSRTAQRKAAADSLNQLRPKIEGLDVAMKRKFLASPHRAELERRFGEYVFARWETEVTSFDPIIEPFAVTESKLENEYTELLAAVQIEFRGQRLNLSTIGKYGEHPDRELRREAAAAKWSELARVGEHIDRIYDDLVRVRDRMAREMEFHNFTELAYRRLTRTDYGTAEVARYREEIVREIVPLAQRICQAQARDLGVDELMLWDERVFTKAGAPQPPQQYGEMLAAARGVFDGVSGEVGAFARMMMDRDLMDLESRDGKAGGGFCTNFPTYGLPFIFANFNGTTHDVNVLVHEMGHAFQNYSSRDKVVSDYIWPTYEACEIHSMSMEFLTYPQLDRFFGSDAQRYRTEHMKASIVVLPYAAAIDHFQHLVYEHPEATPQERHGFWKQMEATYLPWRRYGGMEPLERGCFWQQQRHIFIAPFYYIDYALAMCCAMQFWARSEDDYGAALADYTALCKRGGELPFQSLVRSAGLKSPFEAGVLHDVAQRAAAVVGA